MTTLKGPLIFATGNLHKIREVDQILGDLMQVKGVHEIGCTEDLPETQNTLEGNALQKARYIYLNYKLNCFSEDTGLEIDCLNGEPGVLTARYAGDQKDADANMNLVLQKMKSCTRRNAQFRTVIALILNGKEYLFEGIVKGRIAFEKKGSKGFGYDPIFVPEGFNLSFAEMDDKTKNQISHRAKATKKLWEFLNKFQQ